MSTDPIADTIRIENQETVKKYIQNAIELALSLGDFQEEVDSECTAHTINSKAIECISRLIDFEAIAVFLVDEVTSDLMFSVCTPGESKSSIEKELEFMIENGFVSWAIRERRGITVYSKDGSRQIFLHVMATYSQIRGLFMGIFPSQLSRLPDASLEIVSLILRNAANGMESLKHSKMFHKNKRELESELAQKSQQLIRYEKHLMQAQKTEAIATLAGGVAHQFNNALTGLMGNIELISMADQRDHDKDKCIDRIKPIIDRMSNLTNQLLAYAQDKKCVTRVITLEALFDDILPSIRNLLEKQVRLILDLSDTSKTVEVDMVRIRTAILAIVNNAKEAILDDGCIRVNSHFAQWDQLPDHVKKELEPGDYICIGIEDNGRGMDANTLERLFEPFFSTKFTGRGLGMASVLGIIKRHNGFITVSSKIGNGTFVKIFLPSILPK